LSAGCRIAPIQSADQEKQAMSLSTAISFLIVLVIGVVAGLIFDRFAGPNWFKRRITGAMPSMITSALVGVAGAFVGFHLAEALKLTAELALVGAAVGAAAVLFGWRTVR
jgi:uncharacterized membrane protein YeaQ/YmgE (transglycosylase-associated protein family)